MTASAGIVASPSPSQMIRRNNSSFGSFSSSDDPILPVYGGDKRRRNNRVNPALILIGVAVLLGGVWMWRSRTPRTETPTIAAQTDLSKNAGNGNGAPNAKDLAAQKREEVRRLREQNKAEAAVREEERRAKIAKEKEERAKAEQATKAAREAAAAQQQMKQDLEPLPANPTQKKTPGQVEDEGSDVPAPRDGPKLPDVKCVDRNPAAECQHWASIGECSNNPGFMRAHCRCVAQSPTPRLSPRAPRASCLARRERAGALPSPSSPMHRPLARRKSCGLCPGDTPVKTTPTPTPEPTPVPTPASRSETFLTPSSCKDNVEACGEWAKAGECSRNSKFMHSQCPKSCGTCAPVDEVAAKKELRKEIEAAKLKRRAAALDAKDEDDDDDTPVKNGKPPLTFHKGNAKPACIDANPRCEEWAKAGECEANKPFMRSNCMKSCGLCSEQRFQPPEAAAAATPQQTPPPAS